MGILESTLIIDEDFDGVHFYRFAARAGAYGECK